MSLFGSLLPLLVDVAYCLFIYLLKAIDLFRLLLLKIRLLS